MNILLELFLTFAKIGFFTFGGAYGAIPIIASVMFLIWFVISFAIVN